MSFLVTPQIPSLTKSGKGSWRDEIQVFLQKVFVTLWQEEVWYSLLALAGCLSFAMGLGMSYRVFRTPSFHYLPSDDSVQQYLQQVLNSQNASSPEASAAAILVEVSGAVKKPGVFAVPEKGRVQDALQLAGGFLPDADLSYIHQQVQLAAYVRDQQKIYIPFNGERAVEKSSTTTQNLQNRSNVTKDELMSINGIGEVRANQITAAAPFSSIDDLIERTKIPATLADAVWQLYQN